MNVDRLWKQRIERDLNSQIIDEDFLKLLHEYESNSKITRKRAREISRKLIGVYPDQVISWFNYRTWLSMKYLPKSNTIKDSYKLLRQNHPSSVPELDNQTMFHIYSLLYQNIINQSIHFSNLSFTNSKTSSSENEPNEPTCQNLIMLADVAESVVFEK